jgi:transcriptional regulator with XRE-family HTH domain
MRRVPLSPEARAELAVRIKAARAAAGQSQWRTAIGVGITSTAISCIESGKSVPSAGMLVAVARVLGTDPGELVRGLHRL